VSILRGILGRFSLFGTIDYNTGMALNEKQKMLPEVTPAGIPVALRPHFQEYVLESLDPQRHASLVIERTLAWGNLPELRWLFQHYPYEQVAEWVRSSGWYGLPRRRLKYWLCFFEITEYKHGERIWPH
jgi:hypothetical protein